MAQHFIGHANTEWYEAARAYVAKKRKRRYSKAARKAWRTKRAKLPKGEFSTYITYENSLVRYQKEIHDIVAVAFTTCCSQTKQSHPMKPIDTMSHRLAAMGPGWNTSGMDIEDVDQVVQMFWWIAYQSFRSRERAYKMPSLKWYLVDKVCYHLTQELASWAHSIPHKDNYPADHTYHPEETEELSLQDLIENSTEPPLSLLTKKEKLILYLLDRYPAQYTFVGNLLQMNQESFRFAIDGILDKLSEEYNACKNTTRLTARGAAIAAKGY